MQLCREGADTLHALDQPLGLQLAQRAVDGHAADAEPRHQLGLGRHQRAGREAPLRQRIEQMLLDAVVRRGSGLTGRPHAAIVAGSACLDKWTPREKAKGKP